MKHKITENNKCFRTFHICLLLFLLLINGMLLSACDSRSEDRTAEALIQKGIRLSGGTEEAWKYDAEENCLTILKNGITLSGALESDVDVSELTIRNLDQGSSHLTLKAVIVGNPFTLNVIGKNNLSSILALEDLQITGEAEADLSVTEGIKSAENTTLDSIVLNSRGISADYDLNVQGKSIIKVNVTGEEYTDLIRSEAKAGHNLNLDLTEGGRFTVKTEDAESCFFAGNAINLGKANRLVFPQNGVIGHGTRAMIQAGQVGKNWIVVRSADGTMAERIVIANTGLSD